jgi:hypothetical protein
MDIPFDCRDFNKLNDAWHKYEGNFANDQRNGFGILFLT